MSHAPPVGRIYHLTRAGNGKQPCPGCSHLGIPCSFRPRGSTAASRSKCKRGGVISSLKPPKEDGASATPPPLAICPQGSRSGGRLGFVVDADFLLELLPDYRQFVYSICPVIRHDDIRDSIHRFGDEADHGSFCYAYAAVTVALAAADNPRKTPEVIGELITRALRLRPAMNHRSQITLKRVVFAVFLRIAFGVLQDRDMDFFYLREAITMLQMLHLDRPHTTVTTDGTRSAWQRLHWIVFIQERVSAVSNERAAALVAPTDSPFSDDELPSHLQRGFIRISELYRLVDEEFLRIWRDKQHSPALTLEWITEKQRALEEQHALVEEACPDLTELQQSDLLLTSQWLRTLVWQMAGYKYMLHSDAVQDYLLLLFPIKGSIYVGNILRKVGRESLDQQGAGNLQKLFDITTCAADVVTLSAKHQDRRDVLHWMENCRYLIQFLQQFNHLSGPQRCILQQRLETLDNVLPAEEDVPVSQG